MMLYGLRFDHFFFPPFTSTVVFVMAKESIHPRTSDDVTMHVLVKGDAFEFIGRGRTNNWIMLCELHQDWFYFLQCTRPA